MSVGCVWPHPDPNPAGAGSTKVYASLAQQAAPLGYARAMLPMDAKSWFDTNIGWGGGIGIGLTVLGVVLAVLWRPRRSKRLGWKYQSANQIIRSPESQRGSLPLNVVYRGQEVVNANIIVLRIYNAGRREIPKGDFDGPIAIEFRSSKLLTVDVIAQSSPSMIVSYKVDISAPNKVTLNRMLLNAGEWIDLQFLTDGGIEKPPVTARIVGQTGEPFDIAAASWHHSDIVTVSIILLNAIIIMFGVFWFDFIPSKRWSVIVISLVVLYSFAMYASVTTNRTTRRAM
jgi:hypothetical protein